MRATERLKVRELVTRLSCCKSSNIFATKGTPVQDTLPQARRGLSCVFPLARTREIANGLTDQKGDPCPGYRSTRPWHEAGPKPRARKECCVQGPCRKGGHEGKLTLESRARPREISCQGTRQNVDHRRTIQKNQ